MVERLEAMFRFPVYTSHHVTRRSLQALFVNIRKVPIRSQQCRPTSGEIASLWKEFANLSWFFEVNAETE